MKPLKKEIKCISINIVMINIVIVTFHTRHRPKVHVISEKRKCFKQQKVRVGPTSILAQVLF